jgi:hypothetical protein
MNKQLKQTINKAFGVDIDNKTRAGNHAIARQLYCYIRFKTTDLSLKSIGKEVNRDHATVIHGNKAIEYIIENPKHRHHETCKRIFNIFSIKQSIPKGESEKSELIENLLQEIFILKDEITQLKTNKPKSTILDHLKALPEHVQENVIFRLNSIVKMESSKIMTYKQKRELTL